MSAITLVQTKTGGNLVVSSPLTTTVTATTVGSLIVVAVDSSNSITSVTDSGGNTYAQDAATVISGTTTLYIYSAITTTSSTSVSVNYTGTLNLNVIIREYTGLLRTSPKDVSASAAANSTAANSGATANPTVANELVVGAVGTASSFTFTVGTGFKNLTTASGSSSNTMAIEDAIITSNAAQTATFTISGAGGAWACHCVTYKATFPSFKPNYLRPAIFKPGIAR